MIRAALLPNKNKKHNECFAFLHGKRNKEKPDRIY